MRMSTRYSKNVAAQPRMTQTVTFCATKALTPMIGREMARTLTFCDTGMPPDSLNAST